MYHFIRRFFIFILVLAFGFSSLLCCFVHTARSQMDNILQVQHPVFNLDQYVTRVPDKPPDYYNGWFDSLASGMLVLPSINQFQLGGRIPSNVLMNSQPLDQFLFNGSTSSLIGRSGFSLETSIQSYIPNSVSQSYSMARSVTGAYGFPNVGTVNFSLPFSVPSFLTSVPGTSMMALPPVNLSVLPLSQSLFESFPKEAYGGGQCGPGGGFCMYPGIVSGNF